MSDERKSVGRLLQHVGTYSEPGTPAPGDDWREAVLQTVAEEAKPAAATRRAASVRSEAGPLRSRHLIMMSPAGLALFGLGWWLGRGGVSAEELSVVPPAAWVVCAAVIAGASLAWYDLPLMRFGRGR